MEEIIDIMPDYLMNWYDDLNKVKRNMSIREALAGSYEAIEKTQQLIVKELEKYA